MSSTPPAGGLRIVVLGYVVGFPLGGMTWHSIQYAMGLAARGHDVWFLEDSNDWASLYDPSSGEVGSDPSYGLAYATRTFDRVGLGDRWAFFDAPDARWHGPAAERVPAVCASADLVVNLAGIHPLRPWLADIPHRLFVDADPVFTQVRHLQDPAARAHAEAHTAFATFGENLPGRSGVPDDGLPWYPTRQPVCLDAWRVLPPVETARFTTVMQWDSYASCEHDGVSYGMKSASFTPYLDLPATAPAPLEVAVGRMVEPRTLLSDRGWIVTDPEEATRDPWVYQRYLAGSLGELGVAKHGYVVSRSGWFSERTACYLASGRPAVVQDTGFSDVLPTGSGLLAFSTPEEAIAGLEQVCAEHPEHCDAARSLAEDHLAAGPVLDALVAGALA